MPRAIALTFAALALVTPATAHAQRFVRAEVSAGGTAHFAPERTLAGWQVDAMTSLVPGRSIVGEVSGSYSAEREPYGAERWFVALGGVRQRFVQRPRANVFGQVLVGSARYSQRFDRFSHSNVGVAIQPGVGVDVPLDDRWAIRARADLRTVFFADGADGASMLGVGIARYWGRR